MNCRTERPTRRPNGETDRFPHQSIDWVLFTALDATNMSSTPAVQSSNNSLGLRTPDMSLDS